MSMNHSFWLFREGERAHTDYSDLVRRCDAPVTLDDEVLRYFFDTLQWIPTFNPAKKEPGNGLNWWGPTVIDQTGGNLFHQICATWAQMLTCGPKHLQLRGAFSWQWPYDEPKHFLSESELHTLGRSMPLEIDRDYLVQQLTTLAQFGAQAATGKFFLLHLGI